MGSSTMPKSDSSGQAEANVASQTANSAPIRPAQPHYRPISDTLAITSTVSVVIPVKNEARNLPIVFRTLPRWVDEVVLVDGHSVDDTVAVARQCWPGIKVVHQNGSGKGDAVLAGFKACTGDIIVMIDGDGSTEGAEITGFVGALVAGADYAKGSRFTSSGGSDDITLARRFRNRVLSGLVNVVFGTQYTDLCYGYNAFWSRHLSDLGLDCLGFEIETVMNIRAAKAGLRVQEIPSHERPRVHGESNLRIVVDGWRILKAIATEATDGFPRSYRRQPAALAMRSAVTARRQAAAAALGQPAASAQRPLDRAAAAQAADPAPAAEQVLAALPSLISVVICAYTEKRWHETCAAVESVRAQSFASKEIIVVVDHNPALFASLSAALPDVTVLENREERGLSGGRNTGVAVAQGDVVAFLDDDAVADPDWLKFLADSYADPAVIGVGGLTLPNWRMTRPAWFPREFDWVVGCSYRGLPESRQPVRNLLGGNASFRREAFEIAGGFRSGIGRSAGKRPLGCEETEFCIRLHQESPQSVFLFDNRAMIWHLVPGERGRFSYYRSRCYAEGLSKAQVTASVGVADGLSSERRYTTRTLPGGVARGLADAAHGDLSGLGRAGAIVAGLGATVTGYSAGLAARRIQHARRLRAARRAGAAAHAPRGRRSQP